MGRFDLLTQKPTPLTPPVQPVKQHDNSASLLANQQTSKEVKKQVGKSVSKQTSKEVSLQTSKEVKKQTNLPANQQTSKLLKKFGSYLTEDSLKALKRIAFEMDRKDYEVLQEAVDEYLKRQK